MAIQGYFPTNRRWAPELEISGLDAPAETFRIDPSLPPVGIDPKFPSDMVVIPRGRLVSVMNKTITSGAAFGALATQKGRTAYTPTPYQMSQEHETMLTLADGKTYRPLGFAGYNMFLKANPDKAQWAPALFKNRLIQVPYFKALLSGQFSNSAFGDIAQGDPITAFPGYITGSTPNVGDIGKIVKWVPKTLYSAKVAATTGILSTTNAPYSCFTPKVVAAITSAGVWVDTSVTWSAAGWTVSGTAAINTLVYEYGQDASMIAGNALGLESFDDDMPGWLKWVTDNYGAWDLPRVQRPGLNPTAVAVTGGTGTNDVVSNGNGEFGIGGVGFGNQIAGYKPISVVLANGCKYSYPDNYGNAVTGTCDGTSPLPKYVYYGKDETFGMNYSIDIVANVLHLYGVTKSDGSAIEATDIVSVSFYVINVSEGVGYATGQIGLTDGSGGALTYTGQYAVGIPPVFDVPGSVGILRVMVN